MKANEVKQPIKYKIDMQVFKFFNEQGAIMQLSEDYPKYLFYPFWLKVHSEQDFNDCKAQIISLAQKSEDEGYEDMVDIVNQLLPTHKINGEKELKVEDIERIDGILFDLDNELYELCHELISTPFFMFKKRWKLNAKIKQIKSIIRLVKGYK